MIRGVLKHRQKAAWIVYCSLNRDYQSTSDCEHMLSSVLQVGTLNLKKSVELHTKGDNDIQSYCHYTQLEYLKRHDRHHERKYNHVSSWTRFSFLTITSLSTFSFSFWLTRCILVYCCPLQVNINYKTFVSRHCWMAC